MADSSDIDNALLAKLGADATLLALMPDGVYFDEAPPGSKRFVRVSMVTPRDDYTFEGRVIEEVIYSVVAVGLSTVNPNMKAAAARIDALLQDGTLTAAGYTLMGMQRFEDDPRIRHTEVDDVDPTIRWHHRGGHYRVQMTTT